MEILVLLFITSLIIFLTSPKKKEKPKDVWCEMGKAIGAALKTLNSPDGDGKEKDPKKSALPPFVAIMGFALGATLIASPAGLGPLIQELLNPSPAPSPLPNSPGNSLQNGQPSPSPPTQPQSSIFPPGVSARLKDCIQTQLVELSGIPTLPGLLDSLSWEQDADSDFEYQLMVLYTRVEALRTAIQECDPALLQEILAARARFFSHEQVVITTEVAAVRAAPDLNGWVVAEVPLGTVLDINYEFFDLMPPAEQSTQFQSFGWVPVLLPDGTRAGFINGAEVQAGRAQASGLPLLPSEMSQSSADQML